MFAVIILAGTSIGASAAESENRISGITLNKARTELTVEIELSKDYAKEHKSDTLYLFELMPHNSADDLDSLEPVEEFKANKKITVKIPYQNGNLNRLYSSFAVAIKSPSGSYTLVCDPHYVDNFSDYAKNNEPFPVGSSKKGLRFKSFTDAQILGVQHTVIDIPINEYMFGEMTDGAESFVFGGRTYYINETNLFILDHCVKTYTEAGMTVYFNILLSAPGSNCTGDVLSLYFDGASPDATYYALNTESEAAMNMYSAFMNFICERYTSPDHARGFAPGIILGFEVNRGEKWNNFGTFDKANLIDSYSKAFRVAYNAMRSNYSNGQVYISLGNNFNVVDSEYDIPAKDFLDGFNAAVKKSGDMDWGVSINPYPSDVGAVEYWSDSLALDDITTPYLSMKNIGELTEYLEGDEFKYDSNVRSVIIGELGIPGSPDDNNSMMLQAAAYALAYYTVDRNEHIDAFIYYRHVDNPLEAYRYGLWTNKSPESTDFGAKKPIYNVFSLIDTDRSEEVTSFVKQTVGTGAFGMFMPDNVKYKNFDDRTYISKVAESSSEVPKKLKEKTLFDLTIGRTYNFYYSDGAVGIDLSPVSGGSGTALYAKITDLSGEYKGVGNTFREDGVLKNTKYITARVMVEAPAELSSANVMLRLQKNGDSDFDATVFEGVAQVQPGTWYDLRFEIDEFTEITKGDVDTIKLWVGTDDSEAAPGTYGLWLESVKLYTGKGMPFIVVLLIIVLVIFALLVAGYIALYLRAQYIRRKRREALERHRREQLRRQAMQRASQTQQMQQINMQRGYTQQGFRQPPMPPQSPRPNGGNPPQNRNNDNRYY